MSFDAGRNARLQQGYQQQVQRFGANSAQAQAARGRVNDYRSAGGMNVNAAGVGQAGFGQPMQPKPMPQAPRPPMPAPQAPQQFAQAQAGQLGAMQNAYRTPIPNQYGGNSVNVDPVTGQPTQQNQLQSAYGGMQSPNANQILSQLQSAGYQQPQYQSVQQPGQQAYSQIQNTQPQTASIMPRGGY